VARDHHKAGQRDAAPMLEEEPRTQRGRRADGGGGQQREREKASGTGHAKGIAGGRENDNPRDNERRGEKRGYGVRVRSPL
jgi:hypothetical protein